MGALFYGAILLTSQLRIASAAVGCDPNALAACQAAAKVVIDDPLNKDHAQNCLAQATWEKCYLTNAYACAVVEKNKWKTFVEQTKNSLYGDKGIECSGALSTTMPLISGDSGSTSGSMPHASSNSAYGWLAWQAIALICCLCCLCAGGGGAAAYFLGPGKKKRAAQRKRDYDMPSSESMPLAAVEVDVNNDGIADAVVVGEDKNRDGIPDVLQGDDKAKFEVEPIQDPLPAMVPIVDTQEPAPAAAALFGPPPMLLPQAQSAYTTTYPQQAYPQYAQASYPAASYGSYPTTYAQPTTTYAQPAQYASQSYAGLQGAVI